MTFRKSLLCISAFLLLFSCGKKDSKSDDFSSAQSLFVEYISAYTNGYISSNSEIRVKLAKSVNDIQPGTEISNTLFKFEPSVKGAAFWEDDRTIVYKPDEKLQSGQEYKVRFLLNTLFDAGENRDEFKFTFNVIPQNYEVRVSSMQLYNANDLGRIKLVGELQTADEISEEQAERIITASQNGNNLKITYEHEAGHNMHKFTIEEVSRKEERGKVNIKWDGDAIDVEKSGNMDYEIPSLSEYTVTNVNLVRGEENYISLQFSDPIDESQNMRGMIRLSEGLNPRVVVELNEVKVYPAGTLSGEVTLTIDKSLKNTAGFALEEDYVRTLQFSQEKPEVKLAANKGVIMPSSEGLIIPFEAVSLRAVDMTVVRIFENNILQYLQTNNLGSDYEIRRVGRPVARKTVHLNTTGITDLNKWNRFTIDISDYVSVEPGAIYQVRLNFRQSYSTYFCSGGNEDGLGMVEEDWEGEQDPTNWDYYDDYYYYDWENRDNPCHKAYYTRRRMVKKVLFGSDLGIMAKKADQGKMHVYITNLVSTDPVSGADIQVYDYQQQLIGSGKSNNEGMVEIESQGKPFVLIARNGTQSGYLKLDDGSSLSLSNFNVSGSRIQKGIKGFIYGERGVWRPGDTLHLSFMLEDMTNRLPEGHPVILELYNPMGQLFTRTVQHSSVRNMFAFKPQTPTDAPTGNWQAKVKVGGAEFNKTLKIETVKPNRLKVDLTFDSNQLIKNDYQTANLTARWLHGAVAKNLKASYEVLMIPTKTTFKGYDNITFDDPSKSYTPYPREVFDGRLDAQGQANISFKLDTEDDPPGMVTAVFRGKVFEEGGDFSVDKATIPYIPYDYWVGVQVPEGDRRGMLVTDKDHKVRVVTLDSRGNPANRGVLVEVYKLRWRWWWDNSYERSSNFTSSYYSEKVSSQRINTTNGEGFYNLRIDHPAWGRYFIRITDNASGHSTGKVFYMDWPGWAGKQKRGELGGATMLDFAVENEEVNVGDKVRLQIPSSSGGRALVSLETGSKVLQSFWVETKAENTTVEFEATADMAPNIYAHVSLLQPHNQTGNDLPIRMYGVTAIEVNDEDTRLEPIIKMPDELSPEQKFKIEVSESSGKPMVYTIALVDDGLLDLTNYKTPTPHGVFYAKEALGVKTWDVFDDVMGSYGGQIERLLALGGDGGLEEPEENEEANRFKPVVLYKGPFYAKRGSKNSHEFKMPQYIGSVRAMVIAGNEGRYGHTDKTVPVKQPLMLLATLPRVAGPDESIKLPVNVFAADDNIRNVKINVETEGNLKLVNGKEKTVRFNKAGDQVTYFDLKAARSLGKGKVKITASSGSLKASYDVDLEIRAANPELNQVAEQVLEGGENYNLAYKPLGLNGTNEGVIEISSLPPLNLDQRLRYLIRYPHGCIEQTTSSVFAQLYLDNLMDVPDELKDKMQNNINAAIERLRSFQLPSGAFSYWPGRSDPSYWGTNYAGHFMIEAQKEGYMVPDDMIRKWKSFQRKQANRWSKSTYNDYLMQTYRLYVLALAGSPSLGAMNRLKESTELSSRAKWSLASAYATAGYVDVAKELVDGLTSPQENYRELGLTYGSTQRDQALALEALVKIGMETDAFQMVKRLSEYMSNGNRWMSTQTTAYCLIAISSFADQYPPGESLNAKVVVSGNEFRLDGTKYISQVTLIEPDESANIQLMNNGSNPLFVRLIRTGVPVEGQEAAKSTNLGLIVNYKDMDGNTLDVNNLTQGTDFMAEVTVSNPGLRGDYEELAITQIFPSGWEIINTRLDDLDTYYQDDKPEYQDIRDDRVLTYFDLKRNKSLTFRILLNASYQGTYYLPAVSAEAMYDNGISANSVGRWVNITQE